MDTHLFEKKKTETIVRHRSRNSNIISSVSKSFLLDSGNIIRGMSSSESFEFWVSLVKG